MLVFGLLLAAVVACLVLYFLLLGQGVWQVVNNERLGRERTEARIKVAELEAKYFQGLATVNLALASRLGFSEAAEPRFVSRYERLTSNAGRSEKR